MRWIRIEAKHMVAHADVDGKVISSHPYGVAPIIAYMKGWTFEKVRDYCEKKGWTLLVYDNASGKGEQVWPRLSSPDPET